MMEIKIRCVICNKVIANPVTGDLTCKKTTCLKKFKEYQSQVNIFK